MIAYSTSPGSRPTRSSAARIACAPSSVAGYDASPPPRRPNGVRTADTMTAFPTAQRTDGRGPDLTPCLTPGCPFGTRLDTFRPAS